MTPGFPLGMLPGLKTKTEAFSGKPMDSYIVSSFLLAGNNAMNEFYVPWLYIIPVISLR